jgi:Rhodopirellula transposase DDE domain
VARATGMARQVVAHGIQELAEFPKTAPQHSPVRSRRPGGGRKRATEQQKGHKTSYRMVARLLKKLGYSLQANRKTMEGASHPDRNAQFEYINRKVERYMARREPVISVDAKKKELVDGFKNGGRELQPEGQPEEVSIYDFLSESSGRVTPYGAVCHFPPGTSKWNKIEHRLFSFISQNWRGKPLVSH